MLAAVRPSSRLLAMLLAIESGFQAAIMVPTEILAEQHYLTMQRLVEPLGVRVMLLTSAIKGSRRRELLETIAAGDVDLMVGTHTLIQEGLEFKALGLAVIDEQHRFGVLQRATLKRKGYSPDVLVMTATPIPRTLAMTVYGDLEVSIIDELPPGRLPVITKLCYESRRDESYELMRQVLRQGRQVYVVYPLIEESEKTDLRAATAMAEQLQREVLPEFRVGLLHGRLKSDEKEHIMRAFQPETSRCWSRPPSSRWGWMSRMPPSCSWNTPNVLDWPNYTSSGGAWGAAITKRIVC